MSPLDRLTTADLAGEVALLLGIRGRSRMKIPRDTLTPFVVPEHTDNSGKTSTKCWYGICGN
jgi:hypothetical protein